MGTAFAHNGTKATISRRFRELFVTVYSQLTGFLASVCDNGRNMDPSFHSGLEAAVS